MVPATKARVGAVLVGCVLVAVVVAYPPPVTGVPPLFGVGNLFLPLGLALGALVVAAVGGVLVGESVEARVEQLPPLAVRLLVPVGAVVLVGAYLVTVAGFF